MNNKLPTLIVLLLIIFGIFSQCVFIVHQTEQALILQLGEPKDKVYKAGLHFKVPFIDSVIRFDARILDYDARPAEALTSDLKTIVLDNYARRRIIDLLKFIVVYAQYQMHKQDLMLLYIHKCEHM